MKYKFFYFLSLSIIIFSCSLYYKQYLPNYLNHSIVMLLVIMFFYLFIFSCSSNRFSILFNPIYKVDVLCSKEDVVG